MGPEVTGRQGGDEGDLDPAVAGVLTRLVAGQRHALGSDHIGTYLFGSAAIGGFEPGVSDVDTVVLLRSDLTAAQLASVRALHEDLVHETPEWEDRIEAVYLSTEALHASLGSEAPAARISPGEPFHQITVDPRWVLDWYQLETVGLPIVGPPVRSVVPHVSRSVYIQAVRAHLLDPAWLEPTDEAGDCCYTILTMCRGLRTMETGELVRKTEGAAWAAAHMPEHAPIIRGALMWRSQPKGSQDGELLDEETMRRLVLEVQRRIRDVEWQWEGLQP